MSDIEDPESGRTSVRMGPAFLRWIDREHLGLFRPIVTVTNDGERVERTEHEKPIGPLGVLREVRRGEKAEMRTNDPVSGRPMDLIYVWRPGQEGGP